MLQIRIYVGGLHTKRCKGEVVSTHNWKAGGAAESRGTVSGIYARVAGALNRLRNRRTAKAGSRRVGEHAGKKEGGVKEEKGTYAFSSACLPPRSGAETRAPPAFVAGTRPASSGVLSEDIARVEIELAGERILWVNSL